MNQTEQNPFTFYRYPSVQITYFFAAVLVLELFFLAFHTFYQAKKKKSSFARAATFSQILYFFIYVIAIFCTYIQQDDKKIGFAVFILEFLLLTNDVLFTTVRSALFTSNVVVAKRNHHKALLIYNIICLIYIPVVAAIAYLTYDSNHRTPTYILAVISIGGYYVNQIVNISVFLSITRSMSSRNDNFQLQELHRIKIYTINLVLSGIISKTYLLVLNTIEGDLIFLWSQTIFDGNLTCVYFILSSWGKFVRKIRTETSGM